MEDELPNALLIKKFKDKIIAKRMKKMFRAFTPKIPLLEIFKVAIKKRVLDQLKMKH